VAQDAFIVDSPTSTKDGVDEAFLGRAMRFKVVLEVCMKCNDLRAVMFRLQDLDFSHVHETALLPRTER
jgi:hypothetical protein